MKHSLLGAATWATSVFMVAKLVQVGAVGDVSVDAGWLEGGNRLVI